MVANSLDEEAIFKVAVEIASDDARTAYLSQVCGDDAALLNRVQTLLRAHEEAPSFLEPPSGMVASAGMPIGNAPVGTQIGPYKIREQIGEGGMGVVYVAEQTEPVRRKVALKIVRPGFASKDVLARFEAERQALALMDHPNIAKVLDAGSTESGRPYFVMDLVRGLPLTDYCNKQKLSTRQRLEVFITVCHAVQHAHQKGIIHRDIKPSNILVTSNGGQAIPKVIDFGVAKATNQRLTERTIYTEFSQMIGTPLYMSPEQAEMTELDVDTRSDVYSLGVVLYELLTGTTPVNQEKLGSASFDEIRRIIREEDPLRPSNQISTLKPQALSTITSQRSCEPRQLNRILHGELDWIVMKALEKDRSRRYETATSFAEDIGRYLANEAVDARPPSSSYRLRKFVSRNKTLVAAATVIAAVLVVASMGTGLALVVALDRQNKLRDAFIREAISEVMGGSTTPDAAITRVAEVSDTWALMLRASAANNFGNSQLAVAYLEDMVASEPKNVAALGMLADAYYEAGMFGDYTSAFTKLNDLTDSDLTDFDVLFKASGAVHFASARSVKSLEDLVKRRPSWALAHAMLARAKLYNAWDTGSRELAEDASNSAAAVKRILPNMPQIFCTELLASLAVAKSLNDEGHSDEKWLNRADRLAGVLEERFPPRTCFRELAAYYATDPSKLEKAIELLDEAIEAGAGEAAQTISRAIQFRANKYLDAGENDFPLFLLRALDTARTAEDMQVIVDACRTYNTRKNTLPINRLYAQLFLYLCGEPEEAQENWERLFRAGDKLAFTAEYPLKLFTGRCDPDALLKASETGLKLSLAHFVIAHKYLFLDRNREKAREHFQLSLDGCIVGTDYIHWAQAYVTRMEDPAWPPWLDENWGK